MTVGQRIREIREEKGMTLEQVGNLCALSRQRVQKIESSGNNLKIVTIQKIANALRCSVIDILDIPLGLGTDKKSGCCANAENCMSFKPIK